MNKIYVSLLSGILLSVWLGVYALYPEDKYSLLGAYNLVDNQKDGGILSVNDLTFEGCVNLRNTLTSYENNNPKHSFKWGQLICVNQSTGDTK